MLSNKKMKIMSGLLLIALLTMLMPASALALDPLPVDPAILTTNVNWSTGEFLESSANDGSIGNVITVTLDGLGTFKGSDGSVFPASAYTYDHVPAGLHVQVVQINNKTAQISLPGHAGKHTTINSISDLTIDLSGIINYLVLSGGSRDNLKVTYTGYPMFYVIPDLIPDQFAAVPYMTWSDNQFVEAGSNDGSIATTLLVSITKASFTGPDGSVYTAGNQYTAANLPAGLTVKISKINDSTVKIELPGKAHDNEEPDSINNLNISFTDAAIDNASVFTFVYNQSRDDLKISFNDAPAVVDPPKTIHATISIGSLIYTVNSVPYQMDALPYIANSRTYVPVRYLAYALGLTADNIDWDNESRTVTIVDAGGSKAIQLTIGSRYLNVNGLPTLMDVAPEITSSRTMLPARWVAEALGAVVGWDASTRTVVIDKIVN